MLAAGVSVERGEEREEGFVGGGGRQPDLHFDFHLFLVYLSGLWV